MAKRKYSLMGEVQKTSSAMEADTQSIQEESNGTDTTDNGAASANAEPMEIRATFIVSPILVRKLKLIGMLENRKHKDVINEALSVFIAKWEAEHPTVDLMQIDNLVK
jgi:hypothetical protein